MLRHSGRSIISTVLFVTTTSAWATRPTCSLQAVTGAATSTTPLRGVPFDHVTDGRHDEQWGTGDWSMWFSAQNGKTGKYATVDLQGLYTITRFRVQNTHQRIMRMRTKDFTISMSPARNDIPAGARRDPQMRSGTSILSVADVQPPHTHERHPRALHDQHLVRSIRGGNQRA